jgi:hypothetical protein
MSQGETFDPVVTATPLPVLGTMPPARPNTLAVYLPDPEGGPAEQGEAYVGQPPSLGRRLRRRFWYYEIDMAHHPTSVSLAVPAEEEAFRFTATVALVWSVGDPVACARLGVRNVKPFIWAFLDQILRGVSREYGIENSGLAEVEMNQRLEKETGEIGYGVRLKLLSVNLRPDATAERHLAERVGSRRATEIAIDQHKLRQLEENHRGAEAGLRADLERAASENARRIEKLNADHEVALKKSRQEFYQAAVTGGTFDLLVLQLIEHPNDIHAVLQMLHSGKQMHFDWARSIIQDLLTEQMANAADMDSLREQAIAQLCTALNVAAPQSRVLIEQSDRRLRETASGVESQEKHTRIASIPER